MLQNRKGSQILVVTLIVILCIAVAVGAVTTLFFIFVKGEGMEQLQHVEEAEITIASGLNILLEGEIGSGGQKVSEFIEETAKDLAGSHSTYDAEICDSILETRYGADRYYFRVTASPGYFGCGTFPLPEGMTISSAVVYLPALDAFGNKISVEVLLRTW